MELPPTENSKLERITLRKIMSDIFQVLNLERGVLYTLWALTVRPGDAVKEYLFEDRTKMTRPLGFLVLFVSMSSFFAFIFEAGTKDIFEQKRSADQGASETAAAQLGYEFGRAIKANAQDSTALLLPDSTVGHLQVDTLQQDSLATGAEAKRKKEKQEKFERISQKVFGSYYQSFNILNLLSVPVLALGMLLLFRDKRYYFSEHMVIGAYITGYVSFLFVITLPIYYLKPDWFLSAVSLAFVVYGLYALMHTFRYKAIFESFFRSMVAYTIYFIFYMILLAIYVVVLFTYYTYYGL